MTKGYEFYKVDDEGNITIKVYPKEDFFNTEEFKLPSTLDLFEVQDEVNKKYNNEWDAYGISGVPGLRPNMNKYEETN